MIKLKKEKTIFLLLTVVLSGLYAGIVCNQTMPLAEGWYTYYSQCINEGLLPYKDFEYLYPPLYLYFMAFVTNIVGYKIIYLRIMGVLFYCLIAIGIYLTVDTVLLGRKQWISFIASVTAVFYMQSEVVQIFYDYVRFMDIISAFAVFFLLQTVKRKLENKAYMKPLIMCGIFMALLMQIKQNIGLILVTYSAALFIYMGIYIKQKIKTTLKDLVLFVFPSIALVLLLWGTMAVNGTLSYYLESVGSGALSAKGGIWAILFGWIYNNVGYYKAVLNKAEYTLAIVAILCILLHLKRKRLDNQQAIEEEDLYGKRAMWINGGLFFVLIFVVLIAIKNDGDWAKKILNTNYLSPYYIFLVVFPLFVLAGIIGIVDIARGKNILRKNFLIFALGGAYFAIAFSCGNSGGLAEGQATLGIAFIVTVFLQLLTCIRKKLNLEIVFVFLCACLVIQCADKKMVNTYNWWGMDESDFWESTATSEISLLEGIGMSLETRDLYEEICEAVTENTDVDDTIFCFPQIPIFYSLCDRKDPGTRTKVQWFDVSTDGSVEADMSVIEESQPKAIIIYNTSEYAYSSHENSFRNGDISGTREMREFLYNYVYENGYTFYGRYESESNVVQLWIKDDENSDENDVFDGGSGTYEDPYLISTAEQLVMFSKMVNDGRSFEGQYIEQTRDIDLSGYSWTPIGILDSGTYFYGTYNGNGHIIKNLYIDETAELYNNGFFGALGGQVYNLGIEGGLIQGGFCGGITSHSVGSNAKIINCYTDIEIRGMGRAGGIADNFIGIISNCFSVGKIQGTDSANVVSYNNGMNSLENVFVLQDSLNAEFLTLSMYDSRITYCEQDSFLNDDILSRLNQFVVDWNLDDEANDEADDSTTIALVKWEINESKEQNELGHPIFINVGDK